MSSPPFLISSIFCCYLSSFQPSFSNSYFSSLFLFIFIYNFFFFISILFYVISLPFLHFLIFNLLIFCLSFLFFSHLRLVFTALLSSVSPSYLFLSIYTSLIPLIPFSLLFSENLQLCPLCSYVYA